MKINVSLSQISGVGKKSKMQGQGELEDQRAEPR